MPALSNSILVDAALLLFFGCVPLVLGAFLNKLRTWKLRGFGFLATCLLGVVIYTIGFAVFDNPNGQQALAWWMVGLGMAGPFWCGAAVLGFLVGGFMRPPKA